MYFPNNFIELCVYFHNKYLFKNVLVVRSLTTGKFLDKLELDDVNIKRITYLTEIQEKLLTYEQLNKLYKNNNNYNNNKNNDGENIKYIKYNEFFNEINYLCDLKFDLICLDPFHQYEHTMNNLILLKNSLADNGILICHDCCPPSVKYTNKKYIPGKWYGITYGTFVEFAYNNDDLYYAILNVDCGLGIVSKKKIDYVRNDLNKDIQKLFCQMLQDDFAKNKDRKKNLIFLD